MDIPYRVFYDLTRYFDLSVKNLIVSNFILFVAQRWYQVLFRYPKIINSLIQLQKKQYSATTLILQLQSCSSVLVNFTNHLIFKTAVPLRTCLMVLPETAQEKLENTVIFGNQINRRLTLLDKLLLDTGQPRSTNQLKKNIFCE